MGVKQPVLEVIYMILGIGADDVFIYMMPGFKVLMWRAWRCNCFSGWEGVNFHESKNHGALQTFFGKTFIFGAHQLLALLHKTHFQFTFSYPATWNFLRQTQLKYRFTWAYRKSAMPCRLDQRNQMQHAAGEVKANAVNGELLMCVWFGEYPFSGGHFGWKKTHMVRWSLNKGAVWGRVSHLHRERWGEVWHCSNCEICFYQLFVPGIFGCCGDKWML